MVLKHKLLIFFLIFLFVAIGTIVKLYNFSPLKTYSNSTHNFSFKYPSDWKLVETKGDIFEGKTYNTHINLSHEKFQININLDMNGVGGLDQIHEGSPINIDGNNLFLYKDTFDNNTKIAGISNQAKSIGIFTLKDKNYAIILNYPGDYDPNTEELLLQQFKTLLSTIKFSTN